MISYPTKPHWPKKVPQLQFKHNKKPKDKQRSLKNLQKITKRKQMKRKSWQRKLLKKQRLLRSSQIILTPSINCLKRQNRRQGKRHLQSLKDSKKSRTNKKKKRGKS